MSKYMHVVRKAGCLINDDFIAKIIKNHRCTLGVAAAVDGKISCVRQAVAPTADIIKDIQQEFLNSTTLFSFGDVKNILEEDMQPFPILNDADGNIIAVVCLDGEFDRHRKPESSHIPEYEVAKGYFEKKVKKWFTSGGIPSIIEELNDDVTKTDIQNLWANAGSITFLLADGQAVTVTSKTDKKGEYSWGFASETYGYMEQTSAPAAVPMSIADRMKSMLTGKTAATAAEPAPQNGAAIHAATQPPVTDTTVTPTLQGIVEKPDPKIYDTRKKLKEFYEKRLGHAPNGFKSCPPVSAICGW